jgi:hypothetical protein
MPTDYVSSFNGKTGAVQGVSSINGNTGAITNVAFTNIAQSFSGLQQFTQGISGSGGITFNSDVNINDNNSLVVATIINAGGKPQLDIDNRASSRVAIGDYDGGGNSTHIFLRDSVSNLQISNPYGEIAIGDPNGIDAGNIISYSSPDATLYGNNSNIDGFANIFASYVSASQGISASGATFGGSIVLQNGEFLRNSTNGRVDIMPAPSGSTHFGIYFDTTSWGFGTILGTIRSSDGAINTGGNFRFDVPLTILNDTRFQLGNDGHYGVYRSTTGNDTGQLYALSNNASNSGAIALVNYFAVGHANRSPGTTHVHPNFYIYANGTTSANDFMRLEHDSTRGIIETGGTSGLTLIPGSGIVGISGSAIVSSGVTHYVKITPGSSNIVEGYGSGGLKLKTSSGSLSIASPAIQTIIGDADNENNTTKLIVDDDTETITFNYSSGQYTFPNADGSANDVLGTDGAGQLSWIDRRFYIPALGATGYNERTAATETLYAVPIGTQTFTGGVVATNTAYFNLFYVPTTTAVNLMVYSFNTVTTGNFIAGIYKADGVNGLPNTRIYSSSSTAVSSGFAFNTVTAVGGVATLDPGLYYTACIFNNTPTMAAVSGRSINPWGVFGPASGDFPKGYSSAIGSYSLPSTITTSFVWKSNSSNTAICFITKAP